MKRDFNVLAEQFKEYFDTTTSETAIDVKVVDEAIELWPAPSNVTGTFFHMEKVTDFCRVAKLDCYAYKDEKGVIVRMF